jgi:hypothetical protein
MAVMQLLQNNIEDLLYNYRVNIAFSGHLHEIQRQSAVYRGEVVQAATMIPDLDIPNGGVSFSQDQAVAFHHDPQATVYMVIGTAGQGFQIRPQSPTPQWNELTVQDYGYAIVTAVNSTCLIWETIRNSDDQVIDKMILMQSATPSLSFEKSPKFFFNLNSSITTYAFCSFFIVIMFTVQATKFINKKKSYASVPQNISNRDVQNQGVSLCSVQIQQGTSVLKAQYGSLNI